MIAAVVVTFKDVDATMIAVRSLLAAAPAPDVVMVVENGSPADYPARLAAEVAKLGSARVELVFSPRNGGFAGGVNAGWRAVRDRHPEAVLLLNNDASVAPGFLAPLTAALEDPGVGIATGTIHHSPPRAEAWYAGGRFAWWQCRGRHDTAPGVTPRDVTFCTGCMMLIRAEVLERLGGLPELYFLYYEDVEFSLRTRRLGWRLRYVPSSVVHHAVGGSTGHRTIAPRTAFVSSRNRLWLARRNLPLGQRVVAALNIVADETGRLLGALARGRPVVAGAIVRGIRAGLFSAPDERSAARFAERLQREYQAGHPHA